MKVAASEHKKKKKMKKRTRDHLIGMVLLAGGGILGGFLAGRLTAPMPSPGGSVIVTESASPEDIALTSTAAGAWEKTEPSSDSSEEGSDGEKVAGSGKEYTQIVDIMDNMRHVVEERYMAPDGTLAMNENGYAVVRNEYDLDGNVTRSSYFDAGDRPVRRPMTRTEKRQKSPILASMERLLPWPEKTMPGCSINMTRKGTLRYRPILMSKMRRFLDRMDITGRNIPMIWKSMFSQSFIMGQTRRESF